ncbi:MAG TPA: nucleotidyltransferase family protein [Nitrolancea sp.]
MRRDDVLSQLAAHQVEIKSFGVKSLSLFGSVARDEARPDSDIDLLVEFDPPVGLFTVIRFRSYLEEMLGNRVDLVLHDAVKRQIRERITKDLVRAA